METKQSLISTGLNVVIPHSMIKQKILRFAVIAMMVFPVASYPCNSNTAIDGSAYGFYNLGSRQFLSPTLSFVGDVKFALALYFQDTSSEHRFYINTAPAGRGNKFTATALLGNISIGGSGGALWCVHYAEDRSGKFWLENHEGNGCLKSTGSGLALGGCDEAKSYQNQEYLWQTVAKP